MGENRGGVALPTSADPVGTDPVPGRPLLFLHIPRTGGSTLKRLLESVYGTQHALLDAHFYDISEIGATAWDVIEGHFALRKALRIVGPDALPNIFTVLREPVARVVSQARNMRRYSTKASLEPLRRGASPDEVFASVPELSNAQTKQLAGKLPAREAAPEDLEAAIAVLEQVAFGLTEEFAASLALIAERFGFSLPRYADRGVSSGAGDRDLQGPRFRELAAEHNQLDIALHAHACALLRTRTARYVDALRGLDLREGELSGDVRVTERRARRGRPRRPGTTARDVDGWLLVDGHAADAVVATAGPVCVPLTCRQQHWATAYATRRHACLHAGVSGSVPAGAGGEPVTIEAYDRTRGVVARRILRD